MPMAVRKSALFLLLLLFLLCGWAYNDVLSSGQAGLKEAERGVVHVFIFSLVVLQFLYGFPDRGPRGGTTGVLLLLTAIPLWEAAVDWLRGAPLMSSLTMLMMAFWWIAAYKLPGVFCRRHPADAAWFTGACLIMFVVYVWLNLQARRQITTHLERDFAVTGYAYYLIVFVPYILLLRRSVLRTVLLCVSLAMTLTSFKRGCMVTLPVMLLVYGWVRARLAKRWSGFVLGVAAFIIVGMAAVTVVDEASGGFMSERFSREEMEDGSGRADNFQLAWDHICQRNFPELLFGAGHGSSVELIGTGVHNEWLEFLFSFGVVGLVLYFLLGVAFLWQCTRAVRRRSVYAPHMCMMMAYFYMVSLFSGFYGVYVTYYFFVFMGLVKYLGEKEKEKRSLTADAGRETEVGPAGFAGISNGKDGIG